MSVSSNRIRVSLNPDGTGRVHVNDRDISHVVTRVRIETHPGRPLEIDLTMVRAILDAEAFGRVDNETAAALIEIGWTPPDSPEPGVATGSNQ